MSHDYQAILKVEPIAGYITKFEKATGHRHLGKIEIKEGVSIPYYDAYFVECLCRKIIDLHKMEQKTRAFLDKILRELRGYGLNEMTEEWPE